MATGKSQIILQTDNLYFMKKMTLLLSVFCTGLLYAQPVVNIVPAPASVTVENGTFLLSSKTAFAGIKTTAQRKVAGQLNAVLQPQLGFSLKEQAKANSNTGKIYIKLTSGKSEKYQITITGSSIQFTGSAKGLFYALQTFEQLLPEAAGNSNEYTLPQLTIVDSPRFAYRGVHLDVSRHFYTVTEVKKYIDYLASYKFNTFHWHLTDDQGWRIEIKKYPRLTQVGAYRNGTITGNHPGTGNDNIRYGGYYTQQQIKEVVQYASERYITIIPEIELPGHASAAIAAYPQLSCFPGENTDTANIPWSGSAKGKQVQQTWGVFADVFCPSEYTFGFLENVLSEVMQLFPSTYIHIGGDECPKDAWKRSAFCQQLIKKLKLKDEHELQSYFVQRIEKYVNSKGRKIIGWDEILEGGLAPNATVMSWRGEEGGIEASQQGHDVIMTPGKYCYFDHNPVKENDSLTIGGYLPLERVYGYEPIPAGLDAAHAKHILGAQANLWTEYIGNMSKIEYMLFPRVTALSEVLWSPKEKRDWNDFKRRLPVIYNRLDKKKVNYCKVVFN